MLSPDTLQRLDRLYKAQGTYRPDIAITSQLATKSILLFVGPTCVGKNTVMETTAAVDNHFKVVGTFTSREPRSDDRAYTYYDNSDDGLQPLLQEIEERRIVQYAVNPYAHTLYGSHMEDYPGDFSMADVFSSAVGQFQQLGFRTVRVVTVVTKLPTWGKRFEERFPHSHPQRRARRDEALESLEWSLAQNDVDHHWIVNVDGQPEKASQTVIAIANSQSEGDTDGRALAEAMLQSTRRIQV